MLNVFLIIGLVISTYHPAFAGAKLVLPIQELYQSMDESREYRTLMKRVERRRKEERKAAKIEIREKIWLDRARIRNELNTPLSPRSASLRDQMAEYYFDNVVLKNSKPPVFLGIGNPFDEISDGYRKAVEKLIKDLHQIGYLVVYDADSKASSFIRKMLPKGESVGISGRWERGKKADLVFENPYTRMMSLLSIKHFILSPDSITGVGLFLKGAHTPGNSFRIFDPDKKWKRNFLARWSHMLNSNPESSGVELNTLSEPEIYYNPKAMHGDLHSFIWRNFDPDDFKLEPLVLQMFNISLKAYPFVPAQVLLDLNPMEYKEVWETSEEFGRCKIELSKRVSKGTGAAIFGSSRKFSRYEDKVREIVNTIVKERVPVITGGGGGFMELANQIAFDQDHVDSIGIPIVNPSWRIPDEEKPARHCHRMTLETRGFTHRIPLMIEDRELLVFLPGDHKNIRELATVLVSLGSKSSLELGHLVFVESSFYGILVGWLKSLPLPNDFKLKLHLVDFSDQLQDIFMKTTRKNIEKFRAFDTEVLPTGLEQ